MAEAVQFNFLKAVVRHRQVRARTEHSHKAGYGQERSLDEHSRLARKRPVAAARANLRGHLNELRNGIYIARSSIPGCRNLQFGLTHARGIMNVYLALTHTQFLISLPANVRRDVSWRLSLEE